MPIPTTSSTPAWRVPRGVRVLGALTAALWLAYAASTVLRSAPGASTLWDSGVYNAVYVLATGLCALRARRPGPERPAWLALTLALAVTTAGELYWAFELSGLEDVPYPSPADALYLAFYPAAYLGLLALVRAGVAELRASMWLDGLVCGLAMAAVIAAVAFERIVADTGGSPATVAVTLGYPLGDLLLILLVFAVFGLTALRPGRVWGLLGLGLLAWALVDTVFLYREAAGTYVEGGALDALWPLGAVLVAFAAWQRPAERYARLHDWAALAVPLACTLTAVGVLVVCSIGSGQTVAIILAAGAVCSAIARTGLTFREVRQLAESKRLALTDDLTGLPNRRALLARVEAAVAGGEPIGLLLIDLDHFKELNDTLGHPVGDRLLRALGDRLARAVRSGDLLARLGGDEFAVALAGTLDDDALTAAGERIRDALDAPFELDGIPAQIDASVGAAAHPRHARTAAELLKHADVAMYDAKREQTGIEIYAAKRDGHSRERLALVGQLRHGLTRGELQPHYQPQIDIATGALAGVEALARWQHPDHGLLAPADFLPTIERTNLMRPFTDELIRQALAARRTWSAAGIDVPVAVNIAAPNLLDPRFAERVARLLDDAGASPEHLHIEITETAVMVDLDRAMRVLDALRALGLVLALDDFGVGHSSLATLKRLPVQELKIDRSFVQAMIDDHRDATIVAATCMIAEALELTTVAEGVETAAHYHAAHRSGCHRAQGYLIARPLPADQLADWAARWTAPTLADHIERRPAAPLTAGP